MKEDERSQRLSWLEDRLMEDLARDEAAAQPSEPARPGFWRRRRQAAQDRDRAIYTDEPVPRKARSSGKQKRRKGIGGLVFLALLELAAIGALIGWWIQWLG